MKTMFFALLFAGCLVACAPRQEGPELQFDIEDGAIRNEFFRDGPVAAHIVLKSADAPRLVVAFPAGNSGTGVWFEPLDAPATWSPSENVRAERQKLAGGVRNGVRFDTAISTPRLDVKKAILSNIRVLRDYGYTGETPAIVEAIGLAAAVDYVDAIGIAAIQSTPDS